MHGPLNVKYCNTLSILFQDSNKRFLISILPRQYPSSPVRNLQRTKRKNVIEILRFPLGHIWLY
jgi:hypothetical protein